MLHYHEIFKSIQGESTYAGIPTTFVRLYGCDIGCRFCDQPQSKRQKRRIYVENLVRKVEKAGLKYVCVTGGEPLIQDDIYVFIYELVEKNFIVSIETSGCVPIEQDLYSRSFKQDYDFFKWVMSAYPTKAKILLSPMFDNKGNAVIGQKLSEWILADNLKDVRVQIQLHKVLNVP